MTVESQLLDKPEPVSPSASLDSLLIERATVAHVPYLRRLKEQVMASRYRPAPDEEGFARWRQVYCTDAYFREVIADPDAMLLLIGSLREPAGMVVLRRLGTQLEIDDLLCLYPRKGDGSRLLLASLRYAEAWRMKEVVIDIYPGHARAERFLERHGFERAGESSNELGRSMRRFVLRMA